MKAKNILFFYILITVTLQFACHKENLDATSSNPYGANNGRLVLYFNTNESLPATVTVENKTYSVNFYYPNSINCDDASAPFFLLPEGYHDFTANIIYQNRTITGRLYIKKGECRAYSLDAD